METFIKITRISGSGADPMKFELEFSNGKQSAGAEIYIGHDFFENSSKALKEFPRHSSDKFRWEQGSERLEDRTGDYFRFNVFTTNPLGQSAIQICYNNKKPLPERRVSEFCILAEPLQINHLGHLLGQFAEMNHKTLTWMVSDGELSQQT